MHNRTRKRVTKFAVAAFIACIIAVAVAFLKRDSVADRGRPIEYVENGIRTTIEHGWYPNHIGIAERIGTFATDYHSMRPGAGTLVRLHRTDFLVDSFDGVNDLVIAFQLPSTIEVGKPYVFRPIQAERAVAQVDEHTHFTTMRPGDFTGSQFNNPMVGYLSDDPASTATVTILNTGEFETVIHVRLVAELKSMSALNIDQEYTLRTMADGG